MGETTTTVLLEFKGEEEKKMLDLLVSHWDIAPDRKDCIPVDVIYQEDKMTTILIFADGERIVTKPTEEDKGCYSREIGFLEAIGKRLYGSRSALLRAVESGRVQKSK